MRIFRYLPALLLAAGCGVALAEIEAVDVGALVEECESCHGPGGVSTEGDIPSLAGRDADELLEFIEQFYYFERHCPTTTYRHGDKPKVPMNMCNVASSLSTDEKRALVNHFAGKPAGSG